MSFDGKDEHGWMLDHEVTDMAMRPSRRLRAYFVSLALLQAMAFALLFRVPGSEALLRFGIAAAMAAQLGLLHYLLRLADAFPSRWPRRFAGVLLWPLVGLPALVTMGLGAFRVGLYWPLGLHLAVVGALGAMLSALFVFFLEPGPSEE